MGDTIVIETPVATVLEVTGLQGPQGPTGAAGASQADVLTTQGDLLYRGASAAQRLPIGSTGQILKVSGGIPSWANESGAVTSVNGQTGAVTVAAEQHASEHESGGGDQLNATAALVTTDQSSLNGIYFSDDTSTNGRLNFFRTGTRKNTKLQFNSNTGRWELIQNMSVVGQSEANSASYPWTASPWEDPSTPPIIASITVTRVGLEEMVQKLAETGSAATATTSDDGLMSSSDKTKLNGIAAGAEVNVNADWSATSGDAQILNKPSTFTPTAHTHGNLTNDGKIGSTAGLPVVTTTAGAVTTLALGTANQILRVNSGASGVEFADPAAAGVTGAAASAADVLGVSGANITGVDAGAADRLVFWDDSASKLTYLEAGSGLSISGTTLTATASGGSKTYAVFTAEHNQPPATAFATLDTRNSIAVLDFDAATDENAVFVGIMPEGASLGSGLIVRLHWMATSATSGNVRWGVQFERSNTDLDSDSFDTAVEATAATNGTSGIITTTAITVTTIDGITAGDVFRLKVYRNADDVTHDTLSGDAELVACEVRSAA